MGSCYVIGLLEFVCACTWHDTCLMSVVFAPVDCLLKYISHSFIRFSGFYKKTYRKWLLCYLLNYDFWYTPSINPIINLGKCH